MNDSGNDDMEEDESEWKDCFQDNGATLSPSTSPATSSVPLIRKIPGRSDRVILHFDLDCFYAQVEMLRNPALRDVPLGIQQKYIVVTCNYVARERGVTKLMSVTAAKEKCPELVLVLGEDLTHYREMSYSVTEVLMSFCPLVERLGFDENYVDVTEMVEKRLLHTTDLSRLSFNGHVYSHSSADTNASEHPRLALGSHIAAEMREAIRSKLGLTGCAGIATNKLLAKLVSGTFKPNQQTILLQENIHDIMSSLSGLRKVPGVGHQTAKSLQAMGVVDVKELQLHPLNDLSAEFGASTAKRLKNLALGVDDSPVTCTGAPQSLSDEDSFKKMSTVKEVLEKVAQLLRSLVERMHKDGRLPQTFRLTVRKYSASNKWFNRESRQCPIPSCISQKIISGNSEDAVVMLVPLAMKLFHKMVESTVFHLTLINVCFSNLQTKGGALSGKGTITSFFTQNSSPRESQVHSSHSKPSQSVDCHYLDHQENKMISLQKNSSDLEETFCGFKWKQNSVSEAKDKQKAPHCNQGGDSGMKTDSLDIHLPPNIDPEVFRLLPEDIQKELLSPSYVSSLCDPFTSHSGSSLPHITQLKSSETFIDSQDAKEASENHQCAAGTSGLVMRNFMEEGRTPPPCCPVGKVRGNVDPKVFSELPPDVQEELLSEWKQKKPVLKVPAASKTGKSLTSKDKAARKSSQSNNLFNYFKPKN